MKLHCSQIKNHSCFKTQTQTDIVEINRNLMLPNINSEIVHRVLQADDDYQHQPATPIVQTRGDTGQPTGRTDMSWSSLAPPSFRSCLQDLLVLLFGII